MITNGLVVAFLIGIVMSIIFIFMSKNFLTWMGIDPHLVQVGAPFLEIIGGSSVVIAIHASILPILRAHGYVRQSILVPVTISIINVVGNYLFLYGPLAYLDYGVAGVGISTAVANFVGMGLAIWMLRKYIGYTFHFKKLEQVSKNYFIRFYDLAFPLLGKIYRMPARN